MSGHIKYNDWYYMVKFACDNNYIFDTNGIRIFNYNFWHYPFKCVNENNSIFSPGIYGRS